MKDEEAAYFQKKIDAKDDQICLLNTEIEDITEKYSSLEREYNLLLERWHDKHGTKE